jgi:hypothetical protein
MQNSTWKPVPVAPFTEVYEINRSGDVRTIKTGKLLKPGRPNSNSPFVILAHKQVDGGRKPFTVSKLVKLTFDEAEVPKRPEVDWNSTKSMLSELNHLRVESGMKELKKWSKSTDALRSTLKSSLATN